MRSLLHSAAKLLFQVVVLVLVTGATAAGAVGVAGSSLTSSPLGGSDTVRLTLEKSTLAVSGFAMDSGNLVPGNSAEALVELTNRGKHDLAQVSLTTTVSASSLLDSDPVHGLQLAVDRCPRPWEGSAGRPGTYVCIDGALPVVERRPVAVVGLPLMRLTARMPGRTGYLRMTLTLPGSAGNEFQGLTSAIRFSFTSSPTLTGPK